MTVIRLLADDLTGALDTAAEFVPLAGPIPVAWTEAGSPHPGQSCARDSGTREKTLDEALAVVARLTPELATGDVAYKKIDSLLRGHGMAELATCLRHGPWDTCVVAPGFPHQGRITRAGRQLARNPDGSWRDVADIVDLLARAGIAARRASPDAALAAGVSVFDAETDDDLSAIARLRGTGGRRVLWCGSAGLAQALCRGPVPQVGFRLAGPVLGLFGSDREVTARQLAACGRQWLRIDGHGDDAARVGNRLAGHGAAMVSLAMPSGLARPEAAARIDTAFAGLVTRIARPGTLLVAGGETLRGLCATLGATALEVRGQIEPGLPHSVMRGGRWDGLPVVSKSGAFGGDDLWRALLAEHGFLHGLLHDASQDMSA